METKRKGIVEGSRMFCRKCGKEIKEGANFCPYCGTAVERKEEKPEPAGTGKRKWIVPVAVSIVLVFIIAISAVFGLKRGRNNDAGKEKNKNGENSVISEQDEMEKEETEKEERKEEETEEEETDEQKSGELKDETGWAENEENSGWNDAREAYLAYLEEQGAFDPFIMGPEEDGVYGYNYFSLDYVDGDDIPELIYGQGYMWGGDGERLLSFSPAEGGERNSIHMIEAEFVEYIEGTGMVDAQYGHNFARDNNIYQLVNGEFVFLESGNYEDGTALDDGEDDWLDSGFAQWEGREVTKKEYVERWTSVYAGKGERTYEKHDYTPDEMREILQTPRTAEELKAFLESDTGNEAG